jgi:hypothetical protein
MNEVQRSKRNHPRRSKTAGNSVKARLSKGAWLTWEEISTLHYYRHSIPKVWPDDDPALFEYQYVQAKPTNRPAIYRRPVNTQ